jgi:hypothetical protein
MNRYISLVLIMLAFITLSTAVWAASTPPLPAELISRIPNHLVSKNLEIAFTKDGGFIYDKTKGGSRWIPFPTDIYYLRKNCGVSENLVLVYGYTKAYVYDRELGKWVLCPEEYSYHDSDITIGRAGRVCENYAIAVGVEKVQLYDFTLHKWFTIHGISWSIEADPFWTTFPSQAGIPLHREKKPNDWYKSIHFQCTYKVGSGAWMEHPICKYNVDPNMGDTPPPQPTSNDSRCNDNSCPKWTPDNKNGY